MLWNNRCICYDSTNTPILELYTITIHSNIQNNQKDNNYERVLLLTY